MKYDKQLELRKKEIIAENPVCVRCQKTTGLTIDHIIPIWFLQQLALPKEDTFDEYNFQVLCGVCNAFKANRMDFSNPKTKENLLKYLEKV